jgi:energy-coupling factor transporter ATP-binding protein EcfA2
MHRYHAYGVELRSCEPFLGFLRGSTPPDHACVHDLAVTLSFRKSASDLVPAEAILVYASKDLGQNNRPLTRLFHDRSVDEHWFVYDDNYQFKISEGGRQITAHIPPSGCIEEALIFLLGHILAFVLRLHGIPSLHASAALFDGQAVAFVGPGGTGKSTLAASLALNGIPIISDDVVPVERSGEEFLARAGYPRLRLWPTSVAQFFGGAKDALPLLVPRLAADWPKRYLRLEEQAGGFAEGKHALKRIYLLQRHGDDPPKIVVLAPSEAVIELVTHSYINFSLSRKMRAEELNLFSQLAHRVPVKRLVIPDDMKHLSSLPALIRHDLATDISGTRP